MTRYERARELFLKGYNCSQSVIGAFCDELNIDFETAMMIASGFGGGFARQREVCGAVSGMCMVAGLFKGYSDPTDRKAKVEFYAFIREMCDEFKKRNSSIVCRELLNNAGLKNEAESKNSPPSERTAEYYKKRPCPDIIGQAAQIIEKFIPELSTEITEEI